MITIATVQCLRSFLTFKICGKIVRMMKLFGKDFVYLGIKLGFSIHGKCVIYEHLNGIHSANDINLRERHVTSEMY